MSLPHVARGDDFNPQNSAVVATINEGTMDNMTPASNGTSATYSFTVDISDADTLADVEWVTICVYLDGTSSPCNGDSEDPATDVSFGWLNNVWTLDQSTGGGVTGQFWSDQVSTPDTGSPYTPTNTAMTMTVNYKVSEAAREGNWKVAVEAYDGDVSSTPTSVGSMTMAWYGGIETQRAPQSFGTVAPNTNADKNNVAATVTANGGADMTYALAGDFTFAGNSFSELTTGTPGTDNPGVGQLSFDCVNGAAYGDPGAVRLSTSTQDVSIGRYPTGTVEDGTNLVAQSCRLRHGGGKVTGNYANVVTVGVTADA